MTVTIYHNPDCGTSRNTLAMIRQSGEEPVVIEYLRHPPDRARLVELINAMGIPVRALLREKGTPLMGAQLRGRTVDWGAPWSVFLGFRVPA
jgi:arsenate reductase